MSITGDGTLPFALFFLLTIWKGDVRARAEAITLSQMHETHTLDTRDLKAGRSLYPRDFMELPNLPRIVKLQLSHVEGFDLVCLSHCSLGFPVTHSCT